MINMIVITLMFDKNACAIRVLMKIGPGVTYFTIAKSEEIKADTALACACEICVSPNLGPAESEPTSPISNPGLQCEMLGIYTYI